MTRLRGRIRFTLLSAACVAAWMTSVAAAMARPNASPPPVRPPTTRPATQPSPVVVRSEIGQSPIRRDVIHSESTRVATAAETKAPAPSFDLPKVAGALALVLGLIFALRYILRRSMSGVSLPGATNAVQVLTRSTVSPRQQVLLLRVGRRMLVVADCNGQLNSLSEISDPDEVAALVGQLRDEKLTAASSSFGSLIGRWRRGGEDGDDPADPDSAADEFPRAAPDVPARPGGEADDDASVASAHHELNGLVERVRLLSNQFKRV